MSEFSESYHLLGGSQGEAIRLLTTSGHAGVVFATTGVWTTFLPASFPSHALEDVVEQNTGLLLHYSYADDHGLILEGYRGDQLVWRRNSWWDGEADDPDLVDDEFLKALAEAAQRSPGEVEAMFDDIASPSARFGATLGLTHYSWLSCEALAEIGLDEVRDRGSYVVVGDVESRTGAAVSDAGSLPSEPRDRRWVAKQLFEGKNPAGTPEDWEAVVANAAMIAAWSLYPALAGSTTHGSQRGRIDRLEQFCLKVEDAVRSPIDLGGPLKASSFPEAERQKEIVNEVYRFRTRPTPSGAVSIVTKLAPLLDDKLRRVLEFSLMGHDSRAVLESVSAAQAVTRFDFGTPDIRRLHFPDVVRPEHRRSVPFDAMGATMANRLNQALPEALNALSAVLVLNRKSAASDVLYAADWQRIKDLLGAFARSQPIDALQFWCTTRELLGCNPRGLIQEDGIEAKFDDVLSSWGAFKGGVRSQYFRWVFAVFEHRLVLLNIR